ncbi:tRNA 2-selenouridine synthase [Campylobacter concisus]|uniref:tRNA 2-selenouridine synthase n=1 Tax=Campylobacter concisus TaxID=199 RepID=UPI001882F1AC|nr:tRNA 2-selenouridine synthase [Campylobacter concisus]MBE8584582.1 tRNA 2-selenouridine synthase [Campylobacter concisus]
MKKVKFIVFICLFILLPLAYFNGFIRISDLTSEQESIAKKYGGVYVFDDKLEKEIDKREEERDKVNKEILKEVSNIQDKEEQNKQLRLLLQEKFYDNPKLERVLSNGKKYYITTRDYGNDFKKQAWIPERYSDLIVNYIGKDYEKFKPSFSFDYFYVDNDQIVPISLSVTYSYKVAKFGLFGDEASGIRFKEIYYSYVIGGNRFEFINNKFEKVSTSDKDK